MPDLSPAAQVILDAAMQHSGPAFEPVVRKIIAASLRAAASQLTSAKSSDKLRAIADELEGQ
jgi:hypothetical protein